MEKNSVKRLVKRLAPWIVPFAKTIINFKKKFVSVNNFEENNNFEFVMPLQPGVLAANDLWFTKNDKGINKCEITQVCVKTSYTPAKENIQWDASALNDGSVMAYLEGTTLTLSCNDALKIKLNADSSKMFYEMSSLESISGLEFVDASEVMTFAEAFAHNYALKNIDLSVWKAPKVKSIESIFSYCTSLRKVIMFDGLFSIDVKSFYKCLSLEKITGLKNVKTIADRAFCYTPKLEYVDLAPKKIRRIGESACRLSSIEDCVDLSGVPKKFVGDYATRHKRWSKEGLNALHNVCFNKSIYLSVPNPENQDRYDDIIFINNDKYVYYVSDSACASFVCYHMWNIIHAGTEKEYSNWLDWYNDTLNVDGNWAEINTQGASNGTYLPLLISKIGWNYEGYEFIDKAVQFEYLLKKLSKGHPVYAAMKSANTQNSHAIAVIGYDAITRKFAILDSRVYGDSGTVSWFLFEDVFVEGVNYIHKIDFNL